MKQYKTKLIFELPYDILGADRDPDQQNLTEYEHAGLLLSPGGVENEHLLTVVYHVSEI